MCVHICIIYVLCAVCVIIKDLNDLNDVEIRYTAKVKLDARLYVMVSRSWIIPVLYHSTVNWILRARGVNFRDKFIKIVFVAPKNFYIILIPQPKRRIVRNWCE